jgi:hypothetical protein
VLVYFWLIELLLRAGSCQFFSHYVCPTRDMPPRNVVVRSSALLLERTLQARAMPDIHGQRIVIPPRKESKYVVPAEGLSLATGLMSDLRCKVLGSSSGKQSCSPHGLAQKETPSCALGWENGHWGGVPDI